MVRVPSWNNLPSLSYIPSCFLYRRRWPESFSIIMPSVPVSPPGGDGAPLRCGQTGSILKWEEPESVPVPRWYTLLSPSVAVHPLDACGSECYKWDFFFLSDERRRGKKMAWKHDNSNIRVMISLGDCIFESQVTAAFNVLYVRHVFSQYKESWTTHPYLCSLHKFLVDTSACIYVLSNIQFTEYDRLTTTNVKNNHSSM